MARGVRTGLRSAIDSEEDPVEANAGEGGSAKPARLIALYVVLAVLTAGVSIVVIAKEIGRAHV
jgi:hypothetical protein